MKTCSKCREPRAVGEFYKQARAKDGLFPVCKLCHRLEGRRYYREVVLVREQKQATGRQRRSKYGALPSLEGGSVPFKSEAQRQKFLELLKRGEISQETFDEWDRHTDRIKLPARVERPTKKKKTKVRYARVIR